MGSKINNGYVGRYELDEIDRGMVNTRKQYLYDEEREWQYDPDWVRNPEWLDMPDIPEGEEKFIGLHAVVNGELQANTVFIRFRGNYEVDWGDGTTGSYADNTQAVHQYDFNSISADTETSAGLRQVLITVTPQAGQNLTRCDLIEYETPTYGYRNNHVLRWLDISARLPNVSGANLALNNSSTTLVWLERCRIFELGAVTSLNSLFYLAGRLRYVEIPDVPSCTDFGSMFRSCTDLVVAPYFDTSGGVDFDYMFSSCSSLKRVPKYDVSNGVDLRAMFQNCNSLQYLPKLNITSNCTSIREFVENCYSLRELPYFDTSNVNTFYESFSYCQNLTEIPPYDMSSNTTLYGTFQYCTSLQHIPQFNTSNVTDMYRTFNQCQSLQELPLLDVSNVTNFYETFYNCQSLVSLPNFNTSSGQDFFRCFYNCLSLRQAPSFDLSSAHSTDGMFASCRSLFKVGELDMTNVTTIDTGTTTARMFYYNFNLSESGLTGATRTHSYDYTRLGEDELRKVFNSLGTAAGTQTLTITNTPGLVGITAGDVAIATGKGWTVVQ